MFCESSKGTYMYLNEGGSLTSDKSQVLGQLASNSKLTILLISTKYKPMLSFFKASFPKCSYLCTYYTVCNWMHLAFFFMWKLMCYYRSLKKNKILKILQIPKLFFCRKKPTKKHSRIRISSKLNTPNHFFKQTKLLVIKKEAP